MRLPPFRLHRPSTVEEATGLLEELGPDAVVYCGGTELLLVAKLGMTDFSDLVDVKRIEELRGIDADGSLRIGACTTHRALERSAVVRSRWPSLAAMERGVANVRVRNVGTIGGNLCFADPHSDPATYLLAAGASVSVRRGGGVSRRIAIEDFTRGPYETALEPGELLVAVHVPAPAAGARIVHRKMAFAERPAVTVAVNVAVADGVVSGASIAVGSVGTRAVRVREAEAALIGAAVDDDTTLRRCGEAAAAEVQPVADANGAVDYKRQLVRVLTVRALRDVNFG